MSSQAALRSTHDHLKSALCGSVYGSVLSLKDIFAHANKSTIIAAIEETHPEIGQKFLLHTLVCAPEDSLKRLSGTLESDKRFTRSLRHVFYSVVRYCLASGTHNVATRGYADTNNGFNGSGLALAGGISCRFPSTSAHSLTRGEWRTVHSIAGDDFMTILLRDCIVCDYVGGARWVQICGLGLDEAIRLSKATTPAQAGGRAKRQNLIAESDLDLTLRKVFMYSYRFSDTGYHPLVSNKYFFPKPTRTSDPQSSRTQRPGSLNRALACKMLGLTKGRTRLPSLCLELVPLCGRIARRVTSTHYRHLLNRHAPLCKDRLAAFMSPDTPYVRTPRKTRKRSIRERPAGSKGSPFSDHERVIRTDLKRRKLYTQAEWGSSGDATAESNASRSADGSRKPADVGAATQPWDFEAQGSGVVGSLCESSAVASPAKSQSIPDIPSLHRLGGDSPGVLALATPSAQVANFLKAVLAHSCGLDLFGSRFNLDLAYRNVEMFVLSSRHQQTSAEELVRGFRTGDMAWLRPHSKAGGPKTRSRAHEHHLRQRVLQRVMIWVYRDFLSRFVSFFFYATEASGAEGEVLYFRREVWRQVESQALRALKSEQFELLSHKRAKDLMCDARRQLGPCMMRFLPKAKGDVRPILNLRNVVNSGGLPMWLQEGLGFHGLPPKSKVPRLRGVNSALAPVLDALSLEVFLRPELLGGAVSSKTQVYEKLAAFKKHLMKKSSRAIIKGDLPQIYYVKVDIRHAFDTVRQDYLSDLVLSLLTHSEYLIRRFRYYSLTRLASGTVRVVSAPEQFRRADEVITGIQEFRERQSVVSWSQDDGGDNATGNTEGIDSEPGDFLARPLLGGSYVFIDQGTAQYVKKQSVVSKLKEHLTSTIVVAKDRFFQLIQGIPQGSVLSSLLCALYYSPLEKNELSFLNAGCESDELLMRWTDDWLLLTTDKAKAVRFLSVMGRGFPHYGVSTNSDKSESNASVITDTSGKRSRFFKWCGLTINLESLAVSFDVDRLISRDLHFSVRPDSGRQLTRRIRSTILLLCQPLFYDFTLNGFFGVSGNVFSVAAHISARLVIGLRSLPTCNQSFAQKITMETLEFLTQACVRRSNGTNLSFRYVSLMFTYAAGFAFLGCFRRKHQRFPGCVDSLVRRVAVTRSLLRRSAGIAASGNKATKRAVETTPREREVLVPTSLDSQRDAHGESAALSSQPSARVDESLSKGSGSVALPNNRSFASASILGEEELADMLDGLDDSCDLVEPKDGGHSADSSAFNVVSNGVAASAEQPLDDTLPYSYAEFANQWDEAGYSVDRLVKFIGHISRNGYIVKDLRF